MSSRIDDYTWIDQAACQGEDEDTFYPPAGPLYDSKVAEALAICARCNVREECLTDALQMGDTYGIKGGTTGPQRALMTGGAGKVPAQRAADEWADDKAKQEAEAAEQRTKRNEQTRARYAEKREENNARRRELRRDPSLSRQQRPRDPEAEAQRAKREGERKERKRELDRKRYANESLAYRARRQAQARESRARLKAAREAEAQKAEEMFEVLEPVKEVDVEELSAA